MNQYALRLPESLMKAARETAEADGCSLNQFFVTAIAEKVAALRTVAMLEARAARADDDAFAAVLDKIRKRNGAVADPRDAIDPERA